MKNILFDCYGTLIDIYADESEPSFWDRFARLLVKEEGRGERLREEYFALCRSFQKFEFHEIEILDVFRVLKEKYGYAGTEAELAWLFRTTCRTYIRTYDGVIEMLEALKKAGVPRYLVSNAQASMTRKELEEVGLTGYFDGILLSSEEGVKKPSPEIFYRAFKKFGLKNTQCVYVGNDLRDDIGGGHGAGMKCVHINPHLSGPCENPDTPDWVETDYKKLTELLINIAKEEIQ